MARKCAAPIRSVRALTSGELRIAVKKVDGGAFSNWAAEKLKTGDELDVMTPTCRFGMHRSPKSVRVYVGFSAGSGITPILSIVKGVLAREPESRFFCLTAIVPRRHAVSRGIGRIEGPLQQRFSVFHVISGEEQDIPILHGRLDGEKVRVLLRSLVPGSAGSTMSSDPRPLGDERGDRGDLPRDRHRRRRASLRRAFRFSVRRQAAAETDVAPVRAAEGAGIIDHRRQAPRGSGRRGEAILDAALGAGGVNAVKMR